jgi:hypothetical protein
MPPSIDDGDDDVPDLLRKERTTPVGEVRASDRPTGLPAFDLQKFAKRHRQSTDRGLHAVDGTDPRVGELSEHLLRRRYDDVLRIAHAILRDRPDDMVALSSIDQCRTSLEALHAFSTSALMQTPTLVIGGPALQSLPLDHRAGFIISLVDGHSPVSLILDMCPMNRPEALSVIFALVEDHVLILK